MRVSAIPYYVDRRNSDWLVLSLIEAMGRQIIEEFREETLRTLPEIVDLADQVIAVSELISGSSRTMLRSLPTL